MANQTFRIDIVVDPGKAAPGLKAVGGGLAQLDSKANALRATLLRTFQFVGIGVGIRLLTQLSDTYTSIQNRLRVVVGDSQELADVTEKLLAVSNRTRSSFQSTAELYTRTSLALKGMGKSQQEVLQFTESLNQAVILSGASAEEASAGIIQLSQGLSSGALRGDELRSVLEQLPVVADVIAKSLGVTRGELRALGAEGKISTNIITEAFAKAGPELQEAFAKSVPTIAQSFVVLNNNLINFVGELNNTTGVSRTVSQAIIFLANNLDVLAIAVTAVGSAMLAMSGGVVKTLLVQLRALTVIMATNPLVLLATGAVAAAVAVKALNEELDNQNEALKIVEGANLTTFGVIVQQIQHAEAGLKRLNAVLSKQTDQGERETSIKLIKQQEERLDMLRSASARVTAQAEKQNAVQVKQNQTYQDILRSLEQEAELLKLSSRERSVREKQMRAEEALKKANVALNKEQEFSLRVQIGAIARLEEQSKALEDIRGPQEDYRARLAALNVLLAKGTIQQNEYNKAVMELGQQNLIGPEPAPGFDNTPEINPMGIMPDVSAIGLTQSQNEALRELTASQDAYNSILMDYNALKAAGAISDAEWGRAVDEATLRALAGATSMEAGFQRAFATMRLEATNFAAVAEKSFNIVADTATDALTQIATTGKVNFGDLARSAVAQLTQIIARLLVVQALSGIIGGPGAGLAANLGSQALQGNQHRAGGGTVQPGRGYMVGERGPEPFWPNRTGTIQPAAQAAAPPNVNVQVVNVSDPNEVPNAIQGGRADRAILNVVQRNATSVKQMLGVQ